MYGETFHGRQSVFNPTLNLEIMKIVFAINFIFEIYDTDSPAGESTFLIYLYTLSVLLLLVMFVVISFRLTIPAMYANSVIMHNVFVFICFRCFTFTLRFSTYTLLRKPHFSKISSEQHNTILAFTNTIKNCRDDRKSRMIMFIENKISNE